MRFHDIKSIVRPRYSVQVGLDLLEGAVQRYLGRGLVLEPDFQRGHKWTEEQQTAYVEFLLQDGPSGREILFNHPKWMRGTAEPGTFVLVDGLQRLTACRKFLAGEIRAFGNFIGDFEDEPPNSISLTFMVADLPARADVLRWYLSLNAGGTVHEPAEIERVRELLAKETGIGADQDADGPASVAPVPGRR